MKLNLQIEYLANSSARVGSLDLDIILEFKIIGYQCLEK